MNLSLWLFEPANWQKSMIINGGLPFTKQSISCPYGCHYSITCSITTYLLPIPTINFGIFNTKNEEPMMYVPSTPENISSPFPDKLINFESALILTNDS